MNSEETAKMPAGQEEAALNAAVLRYGPYVRKIAFSILHSEEEAEEVQNDVWMKLWKGSSERLPEDLKTYLGMAARQTAIDRLRILSAKRRGRGEHAEALAELEEILSDPSQEDPADQLALKDAMSGFLRSLPKKEKQLFLCRYWYAMSIGECAEAFHKGESAVKTSLHRTRKKLKDWLEKEGITL